MKMPFYNKVKHRLVDKLVYNVISKALLVEGDKPREYGSAWACVPDYVMDNRVLESMSTQIFRGMKHYNIRDYVFYFFPSYQWRPRGSKTKEWATGWMAVGL